MLKTLSLLGASGGSGGNGITLTDGTNTVSGVTTVTLAGGTTNVSGSTPSATVTVQSLTVSNGSNTINNVTQITINGSKLRGNSANIIIDTAGNLTTDGVYLSGNANVGVISATTLTESAVDSALHMMLGGI